MVGNTYNYTILTMANKNNELQSDHTVDLNTYAAKYFNEKDDIVDPHKLLNIEPPHNIEQLGDKLNTGTP